MEPDLFIPGDEQYQGVNQPLGIAPLVEEQGMPLPDFKKVAGNVIKNKAIDYAAGKLGLNAAQATGLMSILGVGSNLFAPLAAVSALSGRSLGISVYLANKGSARDDAMGGGSIPTKTSAPKSPGVSNPYSGGIGGLHSGY